MTHLDRMMERLVDAHKALVDAQTHADAWDRQIGRKIDPARWKVDDLINELIAQNKGAGDA